MQEDDRTLVTERLVLRPVKEDDLDFFAILYSDPEVTAFTKLGRRSREESAEIIQGYLKFWRQAGVGMRVVLDRETGNFLGECGLFGHDAVAAIALRYALLPSGWGRGLASEAALAVLMDGFRHGQMKRVIAIAQKKNSASVRVMEKLGMVALALPGNFKSDLVLYEITAEQYFASINSN